jgi:hypothetical protein
MYTVEPKVVKLVNRHPNVCGRGPSSTRSADAPLELASSDVIETARSCHRLVTRDPERWVAHPTLVAPSMPLLLGPSHEEPANARLLTGMSADFSQHAVDWTKGLVTNCSTMAADVTSATRVLRQLRNNSCRILASEVNPNNMMSFMNSLLSDRFCSAQQSC